MVRSGARGGLTQRILMLIILLSPVVRAQSIELSAGLDSTGYRIGDWINVRVTAQMPPDLRAMGPAAGDSAGLFEILDVREMEPSVSNGSKEQSWMIRLTTFDVGDLSISPLEFRFVGPAGDTVARSTEPLTVFIATVELDEEAELKDIKAPMTPSWAMEDFLPYLIFFFIVAALAGGYLYYVRHRKTVIEAPKPSRPAIPPHTLALSALRTLEDKRLWQQGKVKEYYSEITEIIRRFFEGRFGIIALELTSDEILRQLKNVPSALPIWKDLSSFFLTADLVKFAKYQATMAEHDAELQMAYEIVRAMTPKPQPVSEEADAPVG